MTQNNCQKLKGLLSAVSLAVAACPVFAVQYDVAAYVWPAYQPEPRWAELGIFGAGKGEWQSVWEAVPKWEGHDQPRKPLWGYENEADPKVMEKKIEAAVSHGVNVFIYDWYWYGGRPFLEDALDKGFLGAKNNDKMKFFLMWANHNVIKLWDNTVADKEWDKPIWPGALSETEFKALARRWIDRYFRRPNYYRIDGKPVLMIYEWKTFVDGVGGRDAAWRSLACLKDECVRSGLGGVYLMVCDYDLKQSDLDGFDISGATIYNFVHWAPVNEHRDYDGWAEAAQRRYDAARADLGVRDYFAHVSVGWDVNPRYPKSALQGVVTNGTPVKFERALRRAREWTDAHARPGAPKLITVNSWNEWTEGSYLEPDERNGYGYLNAIRKVFAQPTAGCPAAPVGSAGETVDPRVRSFVMPVRVVAEQGAVRTDLLLAPKHGQVSEGDFGSSTGTLLKGRESWFVIDFGRELHGGVQLGISPNTPQRGGRVRLRFGESVSETMSSADGKGTATNDHATRDFELSVPWFGQIEVGNTGYRFLRIDLAAGEQVGFEFVRAVSLMRPMRAIGSFRCSDERLNRVFETAVRTVHLCCQDYLWDGIKRDRLVWMGDTHPETMTLLAVFGAAEVLPKSLDYMADVTPPGKWMNTMQTYTLWWIRNLAEWYRFTGDKAYLAKHGPYLAKTFDTVCTGIKDGQWMTGTFLDWPTHDNPAAEYAGAQGLALLATRDTVMMAEALGDAALAAKARGVAAGLERQRPSSGGVKSAAALLALSGLREPKEMYAEALGRNGHAGVSTFYGYYMLEAMSAAGENQRALDTVRDYWGAMLDVGATSFWEDFDLAWTNNCFRIDEMPVAGKKDIHGDYGKYCYKGFRHSFCHGWSAVPAAWCIANVLGIRSTGVGCSRVEVKPFLGDLDWAEGSMALPDGRAVRVRVEKAADGTLKTKVDALDGVEVLER